MDTEMILDLAKQFLYETEDLRSEHRYILKVYDGYKRHVQLSVLRLFKDFRVIVIGLSTHTSRVLQPLDVSVYLSYSQICRESFTARLVLKKFELY